MKLFALNASLNLGQRIADSLECVLADHNEREFAHGEHKARPLASVWREDVYVVSSLHGEPAFSVNDKICRLLFFCAAVKDAGAGSVTAVLPYLAYSRKDRRTKSQDPVTTRYLATLFESMGVDRVITIDVHNQAALENSFRGPAINLDSHELFAHFFFERLGNEIDSVVAPDQGAIKTTEAFVGAYARLSGKTLPMAVISKQRSDGQVQNRGLYGTVGKHPVIVDDMIGSGSTLCQAATACLEAGAQRVSVGATHGLFENGASALFVHPGIADIVVTDSVELARLALPEASAARVQVIETAPRFARCIQALQGGPAGWKS